MKSNRFRTPVVSFILVISGLLVFSAKALEEEYFKASELAQQGKFEEALAVYNEIVANYGEFGWDDYGPVFGGIYYDKGICHLQLQQYAEASAAFNTCHEDYPNKTPTAKRPDAPNVASQNMRWELAVFQQGYCEQVQGNFQEALDLYEKFKNLNPDPSILKPIHAAYVLRRGVCLIGVDKLDEGEAEIRQLFDKMELFRPSGQLLFQAMLDLALGWIDKADEEPEKVRDSAHAFLDQYGGLFSISPYDKARLGFVERLRKLGYDAQQAQLYDVALRFFTMVPTTQAILEDLHSRAEQSGGAQRAAYEEVIAKYEEQIASGDPPEVSTLRLIANCYERMGNHRAGYVLNRFLADNYKNSKHMPDILHEAARYAFQLGDGAAAQYFGDTFMAAYGDSEDVRIVKLRDNVATFMLQSLFRNQKYEICAEVAQNVRDRHEVGAPQREMADYIYGASMYFLDNQEEAQIALDMHVKEYPDSGNREAVRFFQASNRIVQGKYDEAAPLLDSFEQDYGSSTFLDQIRYDRATCYYIAGDYVSALQYLEKVFTEHASSNVLDRAYLLKGDTIKVMSNEPTEGKELNEYLAEAKEAFEAALEAARRLDHKPFIEEAHYKIVDVAVELELWEEAVEHYDEFVANYKGSRFEPQVSVFAMPALVEVGRAADGLAQLEQMIVQLSEGDDTQLLQQSVGSHMTASIEHRGHDATVAKYGEMIAAGGNTNLQTWLMIHQIMTLQQKRSTVEKDAPERAEIETQIGGIFTKLGEYAVEDLSEIALKAVGEYLEKGENPFEAVRFFEELLNRSDETFHAPAEMALGRIESRSTDETKVDNAIERFRRVIQNTQDGVYDGKAFLPEAHVAIGRIAVGRQDWRTAEDILIEYAKRQSWDAGNKERRAEGMYLLCRALEANGEIDEAVSGYNKVYVAYPAYVQWSGLAIERGFNLAFNREYGTPEETKEKKIQAYVYLRRALFSWQDFEDGEFDSLDRLRGRVGAIEAELDLSTDQIEELELKNGLREAS